MISDPRSAPARTDLPWLRRRVRTGSSAATTTNLSDFLTGHTERPRHHEVPHAPPTVPAPPSRVSSPSLDLDLGSPVPPVSPPQPPVPPTRVASASLDLDPPAGSSVSSPARPSSSLDLDPPAAPSSGASPPPTAAAPRPKVTRRTDIRVANRGRAILTPATPTLTLTRLQSGIGTLRIEAACSAEVGDLRIGSAYELTDGTSSTMQLTQGERLAPPHARRPVLLGSRENFETISIDLRQIRDLRRLVIYAFSEGRRPLTWGGTLITTTYGGARVELPLDTLQGGTVAVLLSLYVVNGECVLRAEMQSLFGDVREAARAYGFDKITWVDDRTPVL